MIHVAAILALTTHAALMQAGPAAQPDDDMHVTIQGTRYELYPREVLESRGIDVPDLPREQNAAFIYFDAINMMHPASPDIEAALRTAANGDWPLGEQANALSKYIDDNAAAIDLTRMAANMDHYDLPLFRGESDSLFAALLPSFSSQRHLAQLLAADARRKADAGDTGAAIDNLLAAQRMGRQISHGHTTIEGLVGIAIDAMATRRLAQMAETYDLAPDLIKQTLATMDATSHTMVTFKDLLDAEKILGRNIIDDFFEVPGDVVMLTTNSSIDLASHARAPTDGWHRLAVAIRKLYLPDRTMHRNLDRFYDEVEKSVVDHADGTPGTVVNHERALSQVPPWDVIDANVLPGFDRIYELTLRYHSEHERARLRIAIAAYHRQTGQLPPTLDALVPAFLDHIPADPMTGADFAYQPRRDESNALVGLETIDSRRMDLLRAQRIAPSIRGPRESKWRRYVARFSERYHLSAAQRTSAETILRDIESRAADFESTHGAKIETLIEEGKVDAARKQTVALDALFEQLCQRLNRLPTVQQRASANSKTGDTPERRP